MPSFPGFFSEPGEFCKISPLSPVRPLNTDMWESAIKGADYLNGNADINQPATRYGLQTYAGDLLPSFYDDFYNRIWFIPQTIDFGAISATVGRTAVIWNAKRSTVVLTTIDSSADPSVSVSGASLPLTMKPLVQRSFVVTADEDGEPDVNFSIIFEFTPTEQVPLPVTGVRSKVWAFLPNWTNPVEVSYEFMTEIIPSRSGFEQRIANRTEPRMSISFTSLVNEVTFRHFIRQMASWQNKGTLMPDFSHGLALLEDANSGQNTLVFEETADWILPGRTVVLVRGNASQSEFAVRKIDTVVGNSVALTSDIDQDWAAGSKVYPAYVGYLGTKITTSQFTNRTAAVNVTFDADPGEELWWSVPAGTVFHLGRELFLERPDWASSVAPEFEAALEIIDYGKGRKDFNIPRPFNMRIHKAQYIESSRERTDAIVDFFRRNKGAQGEFFMPTFAEDLKLKSVAPAGTFGLRFEGRETYQDYLDDVVYKDLIIFYANGSYEALHIDTITFISDEGGNDTMFGLTTPLANTADPALISQICWLPLWRFSTDGLTVQWLTDETAQISLAMQALRYVPAET